MNLSYRLLIIAWWKEKILIGLPCGKSWVIDSKKILLPKKNSTTTFPRIKILELSSLRRTAAQWEKKNNLMCKCEDVQMCRFVRVTLLRHLQICTSANLHIDFLSLLFY